MNRSRLIVSKSPGQIAVGKRAFRQIQKYNYLIGTEPYLLRANQKRSKPSVADKISDLIQAIRETKSDVKESEVPLSTGEQLRKLFPSIPPHNGNTSSDIRNLNRSSNKKAPWINICRSSSAILELGRYFVLQDEAGTKCIRLPPGSVKNEVCFRPAR